MTFIVRTNCEFSLLVEADNAEDAIKKASDVPIDKWDKAWSDSEAEEEC